MFLPAVNKLFPDSVWRRSFVVTMIFVMVASLLFWLDTFRVYQSEVEILVVSKSSSVSTDQVLENFIELSQNLSFYERVLANNDLIDDDFEGYTKDKRKALWNEAVMVKQRAGSSILFVTAQQDTREKAKRLSLETAQTMFAVAGFYYDIKTDIDMRIVDESIVKPVLSHPVSYILTSFGSALGATILFFLMLTLVPSFFGKRRKPVVSEWALQPRQQTSPEKAHQEFAIGTAVPFIDPRKFLPTRPKALSYESFPEEETIHQEVVAPVLQDEAPANLPGMDISELPFQFEEPEALLSVEEKTKEIPLAVTIPAAKEQVVKRGEPTIEEYKRRLNELLAGGK